MAITLITHNGETKSIADWARHYEAHHVNFARWHRDYGMDGAIKLAGMDDAERRLWRRQQRTNDGSSDGWFSDIPTVDEDEPLLNLIASWIRIGMTKEEMIIKARITSAFSTAN